MTKFDYMDFTGGSNGVEFVVHSKKFTKEKAIEMLKQEHDMEDIRDPVEDDFETRYVKYYVKVPEWCGYDDPDGGCYTYCKEGEKGSFPAWVCKVKDLK